MERSGTKLIKVDVNRLMSVVEILRLQPYKNLRLERSEGVLRIVLARPDTMNALGIGPGSNRAELIEALRAADGDDGVGCILLCADGPAFCAGGDLKSMPVAETLDDEHLFSAELGAFYAAVNAVRKPVIAAVNGLCLGAGLGLIAQCDIVIAGSNARFALIEGRIGYPGAAELVPVIGAMWAKFMIWTGEILSATRAREVGLVLEVVPAALLSERTVDLAKRIAAIPATGTLHNKAAIDAVKAAKDRETGRVAGQEHEAIARLEAKQAQAPDGRRFADILRDEGMKGLKAARDQQFKGNWLPHDEDGK